MAQPCVFVANLIYSLSLFRQGHDCLRARYNQAMHGEGSPRILVVDDDSAIIRLVTDVLTSAGMDAVAFASGEEAWRAFAHQSFDLALLDIMMPGLDGFELCARIRAVSRIPVIFLSAKDEESDKVLGLMTGGDDYVVKPFMPRELVARIRSCLRRSSYANEPARRDVLACRGLEIDCGAHVASLHGERLSLTPKEFDMLTFLVRAQGRPIATRELYEAVWGDAFMASSSNSVMVHIRHLRAKLAAIDSDQVFIETVWGVGYKIAP